MAHYRSGFATVKSAYAALGKPLPVNEPAGDFDTDVILHRLDEAVFRTIHTIMAQQGLADFQLVRGAFYQGQEAAPSSAFREGTHIQLALRDLACVVGWFIPGDGRLMTEAERATALARLAAAKAARTSAKPRVRP